MIIEVKTIIPHQRANTRDPSIETPPFRVGRGHHEFEENRSAKITIESFDIDGDPAGYIEFNVYANRFETDNYKLSRLLEEVVKRATSDMKGTHIVIM
jgi:hypothetical protein